MWGGPVFPGAEWEALRLSGGWVHGGQVTKLGGAGQLTGLVPLIYQELGPSGSCPAAVPVPTHHQKHV